MKLYISLYTDEDITTKLAILLRGQGYEAESWREARMGERRDEEQLAYAVSKEYALMTANTGDFVRLNQRYLTTGKHHYGIIIVPRQLKRRNRFGELLRRTLILMNTLTADEARDRVLYLSNFG